MNEYKKAWNNVKSLAETSDYYKEWDDEDIKLIQELVNKETPKKAIPFFDSFKCPRCKEELNFDYRIIRHHLVRGTLNVRICPTFDYCQNCGQAIDWGTENG